MKKGETTSSASAIIGRMFEGDAEYARMLVEERQNLRIARSIYKMRKESGLTQKELADLVGTTQSAISRLEDADYDGHSLDVLNRIAVALHYQMRVEFVREEPTEPTDTKAREGDLVPA